MRGAKETSAKDEKRDMLYQGIAARAFERRFQLADHVVVTGATNENGLLHIDLVREVPEAQKPRTIAINGGKPAAKTIEAAPAKQAAKSRKHYSGASERAPLSFAVGSPLVTRAIGPVVLRPTVANG